MGRAAGALVTQPSPPRLDRDRPTALVLLSCGWSVRNYLWTGFLDRLAERCHVTAALKVYEDPLLAEFRARATTVVRLPHGNLGRGAHLLEILTSMAHEHRCATEAMRLRRARLRYARRWWRRAGPALADGLAWMVARTAYPAATRAETWVSLASLRGTDAERLIGEVRPDVIFSTTPFVPSDLSPARLGVAAGIPTAAAVLSWDNLTEKCRMPVLFDRYFVWSDQMARDLLAYYPDVDRRRISVTGTPQFDFHARQPAIPREELCAALGLDPDRPIVAYTGSSARLLPGEEWIVERLCDAVDAGSLPGTPQILVRLHPMDDGARFGPLRSRGVAVVRPWPFYAPDPTWSHPTGRDVDLLTATLRHAAVNVNFCSTMTLDFARFDRPVVNVAIETPTSHRGGVAVEAFYRREHYRPVLEERAARLARTVDEMIEGVSAYLRDPALDRNARRRLVERLCGPLDGHASERIADELSDLALTRRPTG